MANPGDKPANRCQCGEIHGEMCCWEDDGSELTPYEHNGETLMLSPGCWVYNVEFDEAAERERKSRTSYFGKVR